MRTVARSAAAGRRREVVGNVFGSFDGGETADEGTGGDVELVRYGGDRGGGCRLSKATKVRLPRRH